MAPQTYHTKPRTNVREARQYMYVYTAQTSTEQWIATRFIEKDRTLLFYNVRAGLEKKERGYYLRYEYFRIDFQSQVFNKYNNYDDEYY